MYKSAVLISDAHTNKIFADVDKVNREQLKETYTYMEGFVDAASGKYRFGMLVCCDKC